MNLAQYYEENYYAQVKAMARILKGNMADAEDVVQAAYEAALKYKHSYDPERGDMKQWFNSIMYNALRTFQRQSKNAPEPIIFDVHPEDVIKELRLAEDPAKRKLLMEAIGKQRPDRARILELFFVYGYSTKEIAQIETVTITNITTIVHRFKKGLL